MLGKFRDAIRIQSVLAGKGLKVTPLEAYDSWVRYSLAHGEQWIEIRKKDKDETIYRKVRHHVTALDETTELLKVKDKVEERLQEVSKDLEKLSKSELQRLARYKTLLSRFPGFLRSPAPAKS